MAAASTTAVSGLLSIEQYLNTTYRPDVDYVDGAIEERNLGDTDHSKLQGELYFLLRSRQRAWSVLILPEVRVQVSPTRFRIPDVCVVREGGADDPIVTEAPLLCIEVLSPRDSVAAMRRRAQDYFDMGVPEVWIFDPQTRVAHACTTDLMIEHTDGLLQLEGTEIEISIEEAFRPLNRKT
jgi:Uma2 family endonuclease